MGLTTDAFVVRSISRACLIPTSGTTPKARAGAERTIPETIVKTASCVPTTARTLGFSNTLRKNRLEVLLTRLTSRTASRNKEGLFGEGIMLQCCRRSTFGLKIPRFAFRFELKKRLTRRFWCVDIMLMSAAEPYGQKNSPDIHRDNCSQFITLIGQKSTQPEENTNLLRQFL